jgi:hypothetical protein
MTEFRLFFPVVLVILIKNKTKEVIKMADFETMGNAVIAGDFNRAAEMTKQAIDEGVDPV